MRVLFNAAMRWELIPYEHNPMSLVRVKDSSKRQREPKALSVDEFRKVLENIPEPFRTMCIVAMCLGLRLPVRRAQYTSEHDIPVIAHGTRAPFRRLCRGQRRQRRE